MSIVSCGAGDVMPSTVRDRAVTTLDRNIVSDCPTRTSAQAKARLKSDNHIQGRLSSVVIEAARQAHGKQQIAARELGKDEGNFSRDVRAGRTTLRQCADLGGEFLAIYGELLVKEFGGAVKSERERALERLPEIIREILILTGTR